MEQTVQEQNKMIAEFMGLTVLTKKEFEKCPERLTISVEKYSIFEHQRYHTSWDWLMPVVVKITTMDHGRYGITIDPHGIEVRDYSEENEPLIRRIDNDDSYPLMEMYYLIVTEFIEWYNLNLATTHTNQEK